MALVRLAVIESPNFFLKYIQLHNITPLTYSVGVCALATTSVVINMSRGALSELNCVSLIRLRLAQFLEMSRFFGWLLVV